MAEPPPEGRISTDLENDASRRRTDEMNWKTLIAVAAAAALTAGFTMPRDTDVPQGQVAMMEIGD
jgi:hypothetical protein